MANWKQFFQHNNSSESVLIDFDLVTHIEEVKESRSYYAYTKVFIQDRSASIDVRETYDRVKKMLLGED